MGISSSNAPSVPLRPALLTNNNRRRAIILGATGATGRYLTYYLLKSPNWSRVTILHRRKVDMDELQKSIGELTQDELLKLTQHEVDMNNLADENNTRLFEDHDTCFCALGTTRDAAVTAENFRKVSLYMVRDGALAAKKSHVSHFSLVTSQGSNANVWANDWKISHGLLYIKTKGEAENSVIQQQFPQTSIFRPGLLNRPGSDRTMEKLLITANTLHVKTLAQAMIMDAESIDVSNNTEGGKPVIYENTQIQEMVTLIKN